MSDSVKISDDAERLLHLFYFAAKHKDCGKEKQIELASTIMDKPAFEIRVALEELLEAGYVDE